MTAQNAAVRFDQAAALDASGQTEAASAAYLAILADAPDHAPTLNNFGALLRRTGFRSAARTAFAQAAACHPAQQAGHVNLANLLCEDGALDDAQTHYEAALACAPGCAEAHQGLGNVFAALGDGDRAGAHRRLGWRDRVFTPWRHYGAGRRVLLLTSVAGGNVPVGALLDDRVFAVTAVATEFFEPSMALPPHDVVFNAIGDADACGAALEAAECVATPRRMLNPPAAVRATARLDNARRLGSAEVRTPRMVMMPRAGLASPAALLGLGFGFPLLLRAPGFHTGQHFVWVARADDLAAAAALLPGEAILAIEALPARGADGMARKYRVMIVGGRLYPLHLAIAADWKVHYFTAAMAESAAFRAEEEAFLTDMPGCLGPRACAGLAWVARTLGLDYGGVDFALDEDGRVLLFEANATMALVPPPVGAMWDYRRAGFASVLEAVRAMVIGAE